MPVIHSTMLLGEAIDTIDVSEDMWIDKILSLFDLWVVSVSNEYEKRLWVEESKYSYTARFLHCLWSDLSDIFPRRKDRSDVVRSYLFYREDLQKNKGPLRELFLYEGLQLDMPFEIRGPSFDL